MFDLFKSPNNEYPFTDNYGLILMGALALIIGTIGFRWKKRVEIRREKRIEELIKGL